MNLIWMRVIWLMCYMKSTRQNGRHFADVVLKSFSCVKVPIDNKPALVPIMAQRHVGGKSLFNTLEHIFLMHISFNWWVKCCCEFVYGTRPRQQGSWGHHGAHLGPVGPRWVPCWPHERGYQVTCIIFFIFFYPSSSTCLSYKVNVMTDTYSSYLHCPLYTLFLA